MSGEAHALGETFRDKDKLVNRVARHVMTVGEDQGRRSDCIHPSELSNARWCPRAAYYRIIGTPPDPVPRKLVLEMVYERGHDSHQKWQTWAWEMGILRGMWRCLYCELFWEAVSPNECPRCEMGRDLIRYAEVPVSNDEFGIFGNADGDVLTLEGWRLIEVKTIGHGTIRIEAPALMKKYSYLHTDAGGRTHEGLDWMALWQGIKFPFPPHLRQGMIYCFCAGRKEIVFIYDPKFLTAWPKEFEIKFRKDMVVDLLDECIIVKDALERQKPPRRPMWAEETHRSCSQCAFRKTCYARRDRGTEQTTDPSQGRTEEEESLPARTARIRYPSTAT